VRPDEVTDAFLRDSGGDTPLRPMTQAEYNALYRKADGGKPERLFYDPQSPSGVLYFDSATDAAYTLFLESLKPVNQFSTLQTSMTLPGEYEEAIKYQLIDRLAPEYGFPIQPGSRLERLIDRSQKRITSKNAKRKVAAFDSALTARHARVNHRIVIDG
jgi:hypothetical protein